MKKLLLVILALLALPLEAKESKGESKKPCCSVTVKRITPACFGQDTGKITVCIQGNTAPFKAVLKSATSGNSFVPQKKEDIPNKATVSFDCLPADTYTLCLTSKCCSKSITDIVVPESSEIVTTIESIKPSCFGVENGAMSFSVMDGTPPYSARLLNSHSDVVRRLDNIQPGETITLSNLPADTYTLVIIDTNRCRVRITVVMPQAAEITTQINAITPAFEDFATGAISFTVSGGVAPYTAQLFNSTSPLPVQTLTNIPEDVKTTFLNLPADTYRIVVTDSNECQDTVPAIIVPSSPVIVRVVEPVTPTCFGENNGTIPFTVTGGFGPYVAHLFNNTSPDPVGMISDIQEGVTNTFTDLPAGTYRIAVVDTQGNPGSISDIVVSTLAQIVLSVGPITQTLPGASTGTISFTVTGGAAPYTAQLLNSAPQMGASAEELDTSLQALAVVQTITNIQPGVQQTFSNLPEGTYTIVVTDANSCQKSAPGLMVTPSVLVITITKVTPACFGQNNGSMQFSVTGGSGSYSADLVNSKGDVVQTKVDIKPGELTTFSDLPPDVYSLVVIDTAKNKGTVTDIECKESTQIFLGVGPITPSLVGEATGAIGFIINGGTPNYQVKLINSQGKPVQTKGDVHPDTRTYFLNLPADVYSIMVTDQNGCTIMVGNIVVPASPVLVKVVEPVTPTCFGQNDGTIPFTITGGFGPYTANLLNSKLQVVQTLHDVQEGVSTVFKDLVADTYSISAIDTQGNPGAISNIVVRTLAQIVLNVGPITPTLPGESTGTISFMVMGGTPPYTAQLLNSAPLVGAVDTDLQSLAVVQTITNIQPGVLQTFRNLPDDTYSIVVTDANSCEKTAPGLVVTSSVLVISIVKVTPVCFGASNGTMQFSVTGGIGTYTALLLNSKGQVVRGRANIAPGSVETFDNLPADTYSLQVMDAVNHLGVATNINCAQLPQLILQVGTITPPSPGLSNGSVQFTITGGLPNYTAQLVNGNGQVVQTISNIPPGETRTFTNVGPGTYSIAVTDSNGCRLTGASFVLNNSIANFLIRKYCHNGVQIF